MAKWKIGKPLGVHPCRCGSAELHLWTDTGTNDFFIECDACGVDGPDGSAFSAFDRWNKGETSDDEDISVSPRGRRSVFAHLVPFVLIILAFGLILNWIGVPTSFHAADIPACAEKAE